MQGHKDTASFIKSFTGSNHFVLDYLIEEVLHQQSESIQIDACVAPFVMPFCSTPLLPGKKTLEYLELPTCSLSLWITSGAGIAITISLASCCASGHCVLSRFDAHMGVANATIRNSTLGHQGINAIGTGTFTVEHSTIDGGNLISLRGDYGSTWQGEFVIRDCVFVPAGVRAVTPSA